MPTAGADLGIQNPNFGDMVAGSLNTGTITGGIGGGQFTVTAAGLTTITDSAATGTSSIVVFPSNAAAGLLLAAKSCWTVTGNGNFTFNVSATASGAPAGTEIFTYLFLRET